MIVFLAVVVGSIVIAMFMPILAIINGDSLGGDQQQQQRFLTLLTGSVPKCIGPRRTNMRCGGGV